MAKQHKKVGVRHLETLVDSGSGEVLEMSEKKFEYLAGEPGDFIFAYTSVLNILSQWKLSYASVCMYAYLLERYADGVPFSINSFIRGELADRTGKSATTFTHCTRELIDLKLIVEVSRRTYKLNPKYAFKGGRDAQRKAVFELLQVCPDC